MNKQVQSKNLWNNNYDQKKKPRTNVWSIFQIFKKIIKWVIVNYSLHLANVYEIVIKHGKS